MGQVLHGSATTTEAVRRAIQHSQESLRSLASRYGSTRRPWRSGRREPRLAICRPVRASRRPRFCQMMTRRSSSPSASAGIRFCRFYSVQATIPRLTRSSVHSCLQRHGISRLPDIEGDKPAKKKFKAYPIGFFHIDIAEVQTAEGKRYLYVGIGTSKFAFTQLTDKANTVTARPSLMRW